MSTTPHRVPAIVLALLLSGSLVGGCGVSNDEDPSTQSTVTQTPAPSPQETVTETVTPTPTPTPTPTEAASESATPEAALLSAAEMPSLNDTVQWKLRDTGPVSSRPFGLCAKVDMLSIGAESAVERRFLAGTRSAGGTDSAAQEIVSFPDETTTARVAKVLQSWHRDCAARVKGKRVQVRPLQAVPVTSGQASWYLVSYARGGGRFHAFGTVVSGTRMSLITMDHRGQDHSYPAGQDPMQLAVEAAAGKLG